MPHRPQGVVFDMDGLLLDSERLAKDTFVEACREFDWEPDLEGYAGCIGATYEATGAILLEAYGADFPYAQISQRWSELYEQWVLYRPVAVKPGAAELLQRLAELQVPCALATSTRREVTLAKLRHAELASHFVHLVCGGEAPRGKPHPDPYLQATAAMGLAAERCWALEDSNNGVRAAHAAGLYVFQVPDQVAPSAEVRALGHTIVDSLFAVIARL